MENMMFNLFICLIIPLALSLVVLAGKSRELMAFLLAGILMCFAAGQINELLFAVLSLSPYTFSTSVSPIVEEVTKIIPILILAFLVRADRQTLLECALMVGLGFATMENVYALLNNAGSVEYLWAFSRGWGSAMLHAVTSLIVAYGVSFCKVRKKTFITGTYAMLLGAMVFHGIYNMLVQSADFMYFGLLLPVLVFIPLAILIFRQRKRKSL